ncbi:unnamed protein product, partial [Choristocarpus tenellus]
QVLSTKRSHNGVGFGTGNRPDLLMQITADVGPGEYSLPGSTGERQVCSGIHDTGHQGLSGCTR